MLITRTESRIRNWNTYETRISLASIKYQRLKSGGELTLRE